VGGPGFSAFANPGVAVNENISGMFAVAELTLSPTPPASGSVCVHGNATGWYTATVFPYYLATLGVVPVWEANAWTLEANNNGSRRLLVSGGSSSSTLTAKLNNLYSGKASKSVSFHKCGTSEHPITPPSNSDPGCGGSSSTNNPAIDLNVTLISDNYDLTLKHDRLANLQITHDGSPNSFDSYRIDIKNGNSVGWETLSDTKTFLWAATVADKFELRGVVSSNNTYYASPTIDVIVRFPTAQQIMSNPLVASQMRRAWNRTKNFTKTHNHLVREEGFYILLDTASNLYIITETIIGDEVDVYTYFTQVSVGIPPPPPDSILNPTPLDKPVYLVGVFHTHPPRTYLPINIFFPTDAEDIGPSREDKDISLLFGIPGFVYDYSEYPLNSGDGTIPPGHDIDAPHEIYITPPNRRELP